MEKRLPQKSDSFIGHVLAPTTLLLATIITYLPSLSYDFQFDDIANIQKHFELRNYTFRKLFYFGSRWISYWLNSIYYSLVKYDPLLYRMGNLIIHCANGLLVYFILKTALPRLSKQSFITTNAPSISFLSALIFLLHPVQTQTVTYVIQGQLEGLATLSMLAMIFCFLKLSYTKTFGTKVSLGIALCVISMLATGTKEIAIVAPALLLLVDWFFVSDGSFKKIMSHWLIHLPVSIIIFGSYLYHLSTKFFVDLALLKLTAENNLGNIITNTYDESISALWFFMSQFKVILHYLMIFIWPFHISVEYDWVLSKHFFDLDCIVPFTILCALGYVVWRQLAQHKTSIIGFAALWFFITITPRSSIMPSPELLVDYKTYPTSLSIALILALALVYGYHLIRTHITTTTNQRIGHTLTACLALLLSFGTYTRNQVWSSSLKFWKNIVENAPTKTRAHNNYGVELAQREGKFAEAIPHYQYAIKHDPLYRDAYNNLAVSYATTGQLDKAIETLRKSIEIYPNYPEAYNNIASFLMEKKEYAEAEISLRKAIYLRKHYGKAHYNLGRLYHETNHHERAWQCFKTACLNADFDNPQGFLTYAQVSFSLKKYDDSIIGYKKVLELDPHNADVLLELGNTYFHASQFELALQTYEQLHARNPRDARALFNLAEAYLNLGNHAQALACFEQIKNVPGVGPNARLRIASCHEKMGNITQAKAGLHELLRMKLPAQARKMVEKELYHLTSEYAVA